MNDKFSPIFLISISFIVMVFALIIAGFVEYDDDYYYEDDDRYEERDDDRYEDDDDEGWDD